MCEGYHHSNRNEQVVAGDSECDEEDEDDSDLLPADEVKGGEQFSSRLSVPQDGEPGQVRRGHHGGLAHAAAHELICPL